MNPNKTNTVKQQIAERTDKTTNKEDAIAFTPSDKLKLYLQTASWLVGEPKFYHDEDSEGNSLENQDQQILELIRRVAKEDPQFVLKLAVYARNELYLRTAPQIILVECSLIAEAKPFVRKAVPNIVKRPDEMTTCVAYLTSKIGNIGNASPSGSMPASLKRGLADVFKTFTEYQLQKYNNKRKTVKLLDVLRLTHPTPKDKEQSLMFKRLVEDKLVTPDTWETITSKEGSTKESWIKASKVMPYMALLRNLRNLIQNDALSEEVLKKLVDTEQVRKSKQFPYRFYSAYREIENGTEGFSTVKVLEALEGALEQSISNIPQLNGNTFISADNSGSMQSAVSGRSKIMCSEIANLSMAIAAKFCETTICSIFADQIATVSFPKTNGAISNMRSIHQGTVGYGTNGYLTLDYLLKNNIKADRIILFSDMQMYDTGYSNYQGLGDSLYQKLLEYKRRINPNVFVYSIDLAGYGSLQIPEDESNVVQIGGWSDKIFKFMRIFENEKQTALNEIEKISIS